MGQIELNDFTIEDAIAMFGRDALIEALDIDYYDMVTSEGCAEYFGSDILDHFTTGELIGKIENWDSSELVNWFLANCSIHDYYDIGDLIDTFGFTRVRDYVLEDESAEELISIISQYVTTANLQEAINKSGLFDIQQTSVMLRALLKSHKMEVQEAILSKS